jgi:hypothetical protein
MGRATDALLNIVSWLGAPVLRGATQTTVTVLACVFNISKMSNMPKIPMTTHKFHFVKESTSA